MPKWLLYSLAAVVDLVFAIITYRSGRVLFPLILWIACLFFIIAAVGSMKSTTNKGIQ